MFYVFPENSGIMDNQNNGLTPEQQAAQEYNKQKGGIHNNALHAASMGRAATEQVSHHSDDSLAQTGTNISYEGATAPGSGGSAGTGYTSGQAATGARIATDSDYDRARVGKANTDSDEETPARDAGEESGKSQL